MGFEQSDGMDLLGVGLVRGGGHEFIHDLVQLNRLVTVSISAYTLVPFLSLTGLPETEPRSRHLPFDVITMSRLSRSDSSLLESTHLKAA